MCLLLSGAPAGGILNMWPNLQMWQEEETKEQFVFTSNSWVLIPCLLL